MFTHSFTVMSINLKRMNKTKQTKNLQTKLFWYQNINNYGLRYKEFIYLFDSLKLNSDKPYFTS